MGNLIIKPNTGGELKLQEDGGTDVIAINTSGGVSGSAILDEDAMGSNSATHLATQQSIKAYVDSRVLNPSGSAQGIGTSDNPTFNSIILGEATKNNGVTTYTQTFSSALSTQLDFDFTVPDEGGSSANSIFVMAGCAAYIQAYAGVNYTTYLTGWFSTRQTSIALTASWVNTSYTGSGSWTVTKSSNTNLRVRKNSGSTSNYAVGFVQIQFKH